MNLTSTDIAATTIKIVLAAGLTISVYTDVRWGKIFNKITFPLILAGFLLNSLFFGLEGSLESLKGFGSHFRFRHPIACMFHPDFLLQFDCLHVRRQSK